MGRLRLAAVGSTLRRVRAAAAHMWANTAARVWAFVAAHARIAVARRVWPGVLLCMWATAAYAHIASNGFLTLNVEGSNLTGSIELTLRDAELAVGLDSNGDGRINWGEVRSHQHELELYVRSRLALGYGASRCSEQFGSVAINERVDGNYLWLPFTAACGS